MGGEVPSTIVLSEPKEKAAPATATLSVKRRYPKRWPTDEALSRYIEMKLSHIDEHRRDAVRNKDGQSIREVVTAEFREKRDQGRYISSRFWANITTQFSLDTCEFEALDDPPLRGIQSA